MPDLRLITVGRDVISVGAVGRRWVDSGVGPVAFGIVPNGSGFEYETHLPLGTAEDLHDKLGLAIDEAKREAAGDE